MSGRRRLSWLPRWLFRLTLTASAALIVLVLLAPVVDNGAARPAGWRRVAALFARDATLRRTAFASAVGLTVTACTFFRPATAPAPVPRKRRQPGPTPPPAGAAGA